MTHLALLMLAMAGFLALCAGLPRHQPAMVKRKLQPRASRAMRLVGWSLLAGLFALAWQAFGFGRAMVVTAGYATVGALVAVFALNRRQA